MKYKILLILFLFFTIILFIKRDSSQIIYRINAEHSKTLNYEYSYKNKKYSIKSKNGNLNINYNNNIITFKGFVLNNKSEKRLDLKNISGDYKIIFNYFVPQTKNSITKLFLYYKKKDKKIIKMKLPVKNRLNLFSKTFTIKNNDRIIFKKIGKNPVVISQLIITKNKNNKKLIFLIGVDTLRRDSIGIYNNKKKVTPNINKFSSDSIIFYNAYSTSPWTLPSFTSLFTSLYPKHHKINYGNIKIGNSLILLSEILQKRFITIGFTGNHFLSKDFNFYRGFDVYEEYMKDGLDPKASFVLFNKVRKVVDLIPNDTFYFLHTYQVHNVYKPEANLAKKYYRLINSKSKKFRLNPLLIISYGLNMKKIVSNEKLKEYRDVYDAGVYTFDYRFGEFIRFLKKNELYKNSMIILFSDHGEEFMDHGCWEHGHSLYNELIKVPLIIKLPGNKNKGKIIKKNVSLVDIFPTILKYYNINYNDFVNYKIDGKNIFEKNSKKREVTSYLSPYALRKGIPGKSSIIYKNYKIIINQKMTKDDLNYFKSPPDFKGLVEVYNLEKDPEERNNIYKYIKDREVIKLIKKILKEKFGKGEKEFLKEMKQQLKTLGYN